jgi:hypothetical protein
VKPLLLLAPTQAGRPARERRRIDLCRTDAGDAAPHADYAAVIVLNDGRVATIRRLRLALALREQHKNLAIGVLTYLGGPRHTGAGFPPADAGPLPALGQFGPELRVELRDAVLSLEYQAV